MSEPEALRSNTQKKYRKKHKDEARKYLRRWRSDNPEKYKEQLRRANEANPVRLWCRSTIKNHRRRGYDVAISVDELERMATQVRECLYCSSVLDWSLGTKGKTKPNSPSLDRINNGHSIKIDTVQVICCQCNLMKGDRSEKELLDHAIRLVENLKKKGSNE